MIIHPFPCSIEKYKKKLKSKKESNCAGFRIFNHKTKELAIIVEFNIVREKCLIIISHIHKYIRREKETSKIIRDLYLNITKSGPNDGKMNDVYGKW